MTGVPLRIRLLEATYPAWTSIVQNILVNSYNALLEVDDPRFVVVGGGNDDVGWLEFRDNGSGVDLSRADQLWEPFERQLFLPREREEAGLGGMGLGLTIIRMIADEVGLRIRLVPPPQGFATALRMDWRERHDKTRIDLRRSRDARGRVGTYGDGPSQRSGLASGARFRNAARRYGCWPRRARSGVQEQPC